MPSRVWLFALLVALAPAIARAEPPIDQLSDELRLGDVDQRIGAVKRLEYDGSAEAMSLLIAAAKRETNEEVLAQLLRVLGESGALEALGIIQTHAQSPIESLQVDGRRALKRWLEVNRVLREEQALPDPPHAFYAAPPSFGPDHAAGNALDPDASAPRYEPPAADGAPRGLHFEEGPIVGLAAAGAIILGCTYLADAIGAAVAVGSGAGAKYGVMFIPVGGPMATGSMLMHEADDGGVIILVSGGVQLFGATLLVAGLAASELKLAPNSVSLSPSGADIKWRF